MISFWNGDRPLAALTYYATHPQSYYRTGLANPDFPGIARDQRQLATKIPHIHFNGAGGNVTAGKFNDGATANRQVLADRVALGMAQALAATVKTPITAADIGWQSIPIALPLAQHLDESRLQSTLDDDSKPLRERATAATTLAWLRRCQSGDKIPISCLRLGKARVLHMPGELFVEYQLAAQKMRPGLFVAMAAYGDYARAISEPKLLIPKVVTKLSLAFRWSLPLSSESSSRPFPASCPIPALAQPSSNNPDSLTKRSSALSPLNC